MMFLHIFFPSMVVIMVSGLLYTIYTHHTGEFMKHIIEGDLSHQFKLIAPTPFRLWILENLRFRIRREDNRYRLECSAFLTGWYNVPVSSQSSSEFYGRWWSNDTTEIDLAKRRVIEVQADISKWIEASSTHDYTQTDDRVIETVKYKKM
jgi:hypothetical protein